MIEALESFRQGWENSDRRSKDAFKLFFEASTQLAEFRGCADEFYKHVRCGILHQAETTGGWRIIRKGLLFDSSSLTINASKFMRSLEQELAHICDILESADWNSEEWNRVRTKLYAICRNFSV